MPYETDRNVCACVSSRRRLGQTLGQIRKPFRNRKPAVSFLSRGQKRVSFEALKLRDRQAYFEDYVTCSTYHSNAIEGSTLSYAGTYVITERIVAGGFVFALMSQL